MRSSTLFALWIFQMSKFIAYNGRIVTIILKLMSRLMQLPLLLVMSWTRCGANMQQY